MCIEKRFVSIKSKYETIPSTYFSTWGHGEQSNVMYLKHEVVGKSYNNHKLERVNTLGVFDQHIMSKK